MRLPTLGLLARIVVALAAVGLAPLAVAPYLVSLNRAAVAEQVLRTHALAARSTAARIEAFLDGLRDAARGVALNPEVYLSPRSASARETIAGLLQAQPLVVGLAIENAQGEEAIRVQSRARADAVATVLAAPSAAALDAQRVDGQVWIRMQLPLPEGRGRARLVADGSPLAALLQAEELGRDAILVVASASTGLLFGSDPDVTLASFPPGLVAAGRSGRVSGSSRFSGGAAGDALGAYAPVADSDWFVLSRQPARIAEEVAERMRRQALLAVGLAIGLAALLSATAYRGVVRPVREMIRAQSRLAGLPGPTLKGDEIAQLQAGIAALERQTRDRAEIGRVFLGRYVVSERIGGGGMGSVFRGWDPKLQRPVALKTIRASGAGALALEEAVTVARFSHPNIVAVYDVEDAGEAAFIAMELVDGTSLDRLLALRRGLPVGEAVPLGAAIAHALAAAHAHGIVHRDVKPANVLLGRDGAIKVTDFGIASSLAGRAGRVYGTPGYVPPEAVRGRAQDASGDLFALGVILYECLAGQPLFSGRSVEEILFRTATSDAPPLRQVQASLPEPVEALVMGLLRRQPEQREPARAWDLAARLDKLSAQNDWRWSAELPPENGYDGDHAGDTGVIRTSGLIEPPAALR